MTCAGESVQDRDGAVSPTVPRDSRGTGACPCGEVEQHGVPTRPKKSLQPLDALLKLRSPFGTGIRSQVRTGKYATDRWCERKGA